MDAKENKNTILLKSLNYGYVNTVNVNLLCPICQLPLLNPVVTPCGHTFCKDCIQESLKVSDKCPYDRIKIKKEEFKKVDRLILNILNELEIYCPNKVNGCTYTCQRQFLYQHYHECEYGLIDCPHEQCNKKVLKKDLKDHIDQCDYRKIKCEFCYKEYLQKDKMDHISNCEEFEKASPSLKGDTIIHCKYKKYGCSWKDKLKNIEIHQNECPYHQFEGFFENVYSKNQKILEAENSELRKKVCQLTDEVTSLKKELNEYKNNETANSEFEGIKNDLARLRFDMDSIRLTLNELEMRFTNFYLEENVGMQEEIESIRNSSQSLQFKFYSFMKYMKENLILNHESSSSNNLSSIQEDNSFIPNNTHKLKSSSLLNHNKNKMMVDSTNDCVIINNSSRSRPRSDSDTGSCSSEAIRKERRFSKI